MVNGLGMRAYVYILDIRGFQQWRNLCIICINIIIAHVFTLDNPVCRFIGEESFSENGAQIKFTDEPTWMIDPIDGTSNFVHG